jgi:hypothetical protein
MTLLAKLILLAVMYPTSLAYQGITYPEIGLSRTTVLDYGIQQYDHPSNVSYTHCESNANLYLFVDGNYDLHWYVLPNDNVLYSCIVYFDNKAHYLTFYDAPSNYPSSDSYSVGIDYATFSRGRYEGFYQTIIRTLPISN